MSTPDPALIDRSWLTGSPCTAPCWYGLELTKSTKEEAITATSKLLFVSSDAPELVTTEYWEVDGEQYKPEDVVYYECKSPPELYCVVQFFREGYLYEIDLLPNYEITFSEVVGQLGEPTAFWINRISPEAKGCRVLLVWEDRQMFTEYDEGILSSIFAKEDLCDVIYNEDYKIPGELSVQSVHIVSNEILMELSKHSSYVLWNGFFEDK
jgi:hypothetical protein